MEMIEKCVYTRTTEFPLGLSIKKDSTSEETIRFMAFIDGCKVGYARLELGDYRPVACPPSAGYLGHLAVGKLHRKHGIGGTLIDSVIIESRAHRYTQLYVEVFPQEESTIRLYKKKGFDFTGGVGPNLGPMMATQDPFLVLRGPNLRLERISRINPLSERLARIDSISTFTEQ